MGNFGLWPVSLRECADVRLRRCLRWAVPDSAHTHLELVDTHVHTGTGFLHFGCF